jgi:peptide/nickel transport system substrate-binding protein
MTGNSERCGGTLRVGLDAEVDIIDPPASFGGWNTARVVQQMFESLVEDDLSAEGLPYTRLVPALAEKCHVSEDGLTYTFSLRRNVRFHDGTPFDAEAAKFNIDRMWNPVAPQYSAVAADYNQIATQSIRNVLVADSHTLQITLSEPYADFLRYMTQEDAPGSFVFVSPSALKKYGNEGIADRAPGTGPYKFKERFSTPFGIGVVLERNRDYWGEPPYLDEIVFVPLPNAADRATALERGDVDVVYGPDPLRLPALRERGFVVNEVAVPYLWYFSFNMRERPLNDVRVRRAIAHAINRTKLSKQLFGEATAAADGIIPPASPSFEPDFPTYYPYDPCKAKALLVDAGFPDGFHFKMLVARSGSGQIDPLAICDWLISDLSQIGIAAEVEVRDDWISYCDEWHRGIPAGIGASEMSWGMSCDVWLEQVLHSRYSSPKGFNTGYYNREEVDRLLDLARTELIESRRIELYRIAHRLIMEDLPILPLLTLRSGNVVHGPNVKGFRFPAQNWHDFRQVWLER